MIMNTREGGYLLPSELPKENPVCVHNWGQHPDRHGYICLRCGYFIGVHDLLGPKEGQKR